MNTIKLYYTIAKELTTVRQKCLLAIYALNRLIGRRRLFPEDMILKSDGVIYNCGRTMEELTVACSLFEPELKSYFNIEIGNYADIGANIGKHCLWIAKKYPLAKVYAFEPDKETFRLLKDGIEKNKLTNILPANIALSNEEKTITLYCREFHPATNSTSHSNNSYQEYSVEGKQLDNLLLSVDLMKIDVEGAEIPVLEGSRKIIQKCKPKIIFEAWDAEAYHKIMTFLEPYGYFAQRIDEYNYVAQCSGEKK